MSNRRQSALHQHLGDLPAHLLHHCQQCNRSFGAEAGLEQHLRTAPAHLPSLDCLPCDQSFTSQDALEEHLQTSPTHVSSFDCLPCNRSFASQDGLDKHLMMASVHLPSFDCSPCNRSFTTQAALDTHLKESPAHKPPFECTLCNKSFSRQKSLDQHLAMAPAHLPSSDCPERNCKLKTQQALNAHLGDALVHPQEQPKTPIDFFFQSYPSFIYNRSLPPTESFSSLRKHERWRPRSDESKDAWDRYQTALQSEFDEWFGSDSDLTAWHTLCQAIDIRPLPRTCAQCKQAVHGLFVSIIDLIEWGRKGGKGKVQVFDSLENLKNYTRHAKKIFIFGRDRPGSGNVVLKFLLRKIVV